ncbi:MAG: polysaccharide pyruvyl transferase family protein, partial [Anaerolineales bacterium]
MTSDRSLAILIAGHFGFGNLGDEAILASMVTHLRELAPALKLCVVSGEPDATRTLHGVQAVDWRDWEQVISLAAASDLLLLGGGGLFHDYWGFDPDTLLTGEHAGLSFFGGLPLLGALLEKPVMLYAVGVGPLHSALGRAYTRTLFELASRASVRDAASLEQLRAIGAPTDGVQLTADPAFDLADQPAPAAPPEGAEQPHVGVALREWSIDVSPEYWERQVAAALDAFLDRYGGGVVFIPFQSGRGAV